MSWGDFQTLDLLFENDRQYSRQHTGQYMFPVDEQEMNRCDLMHQFFYLARRRKLYSPRTLDLDNLDRVPGGPRILDLGFGTAKWILDVARKLWNETECQWNPSLVQGYDICSAMQPKTIYENVKLDFANIEKPWPTESSWNLIHARMIAGGIKSWPNLYSQVFQSLTPGSGWFEHVEIDWHFRNDSGDVTQFLKQWSDELLDAMGYAELVQTLADIGFSDIEQEVIHVRVNGGSTDLYEKDKGRWFNLGLHQSIAAMNLAPLTRLKGWTVDQVEDLENKVLHEIQNQSNTSYCRVYIWTAKRPS